MLLAEGGWSEDDALSDDMFHVYVDGKNRALQLVRFNGGGQLYEDRGELVRFLEQVARRASEPDRHPLEGGLAHAGDFVSHVPELVASLPAALGLDALPPRTLDGPRHRRGCSSSCWLCALPKAGSILRARRVRW